jgi:transglutaminase-like putative cysteine protease
MDVPPDPAPMDFAAWMEVWLGDQWWTFDPRNNIRRKGRVVIGRGRDASDVDRPGARRLRRRNGNDVRRSAA